MKSEKDFVSDPERDPEKDYMCLYLLKPNFKLLQCESVRLSLLLACASNPLKLG